MLTPRQSATLDANEMISKSLYLSLFVVAVLTLLFPTVTNAGYLGHPENIKSDGVKCGTPPKAYAYFSWDKAHNADAYRFYSRLPDSQYTSYDEIKSTSYTLGFNPELDFYIAVTAVNYGPSGEVESTGSGTTVEEYFLPAQRQCLNQATNTTATETAERPTLQPSLTKTKQTASVSAEANSTEKDQTKALEEATAKVAELEVKLQIQEQKTNELAQRQSALEALVQSLLNFFNRLFGR